MVHNYCNMIVCTCIPSMHVSACTEIPPISYKLHMSKLISLVAAENHVCSLVSFLVLICCHGFLITSVTLYGYLTGLTIMFCNPAENFRLNVTVVSIEWT